MYCVDHRYCCYTVQSKRPTNRLGRSLSSISTFLSPKTHSFAIQSPTSFIEIHVSKKTTNLLYLNLSSSVAVRSRILGDHTFSIFLRTTPFENLASPVETSLSLYIKVPEALYNMDIMLDDSAESLSHIYSSPKMLCKTVHGSPKKRCTTHSTQSLLLSFRTYRLSLTVILFLMVLSPVHAMEASSRLRSANDICLSKTQITDVKRELHLVIIKSKEMFTSLVESERKCVRKAIHRIMLNMTDEECHYQSEVAYQVLQSFAGCMIGPRREEGTIKELRRAAKMVLKKAAPSYQQNPRTLSGRVRRSVFSASPITPGECTSGYHWCCSHAGAFWQRLCFDVYCDLNGPFCA